MASKLINIRYILYILFPIATFYLLDKAVQNINEDQIKYQFIYSLEDTLKPSSTYFTYGDQLNISSDTIMKIDSYSADEVLLIIEKFKPEYEALYKQGEYNDERFKVFNIQKIDFTKLSRDKIVVDYYIKYIDSKIVDEAIRDFNSLVEEDISALLLPNGEAAEKRVLKFIRFLKDKIILDKKLNLSKIKRLDFDLKTMQIKVDTLYKVITKLQSKQNLDRLDVIGDIIEKNQKETFFKEAMTSSFLADLKSLINEINFYETLTVLRNNPLQVEIDELRIDIESQTFTSLATMYLNQTTYLLGLIKNRMGINLMDTKIINIIDTSKVSSLIKIIFTLVLTLFFISLLELFVIKIKKA